MTEGIPFLGFVVYPDRRRLKRRKGIHYRRRLARLVRLQAADELEPEAIEASVRGWCNHVGYANTTGLRRAVLESATMRRQTQGLIEGRTLMTIRAQKIRSTNVADVQFQGVDAETATRLAGSLTSPGNVEAEEIDAETVAGLQILGPIDTIDRLRAEVMSLRRRLEGLDAAGAGDIRAELDAATEELKRPRPAPDVVVPKLAKAAEILEKGSQMTAAADKLGTSLAKLVPVAQALWHAAVSLLGG